MRHHTDNNNLTVFGHAPMTTGEATAYVSIWFLLWGALTMFLLHKFERRKGDEWVSRLVSVCHAAVSCLIAAVAIVDAYPNGWFGTPTTFWEQAALGVSIAYFAVDFIGIWFGSYYDNLFLWHHICSGWGLGVACFSGHDGWELTVCLFCMELSNPFLHTRWLLQYENYCDNDSWAMYLCTECFWWIFTIVRITFGTPYAIMMITSPDVPVLLKFLGGAIMAFSWKFWIELMGKRWRREAWKA